MNVKTLLIGGAALLLVAAAAGYWAAPSLPPAPDAGAPPAGAMHAPGAPSAAVTTPATVDHAPAPWVGARAPAAAGATAPAASGVGQLNDLTPATRARVEQAQADLAASMRPGVAPDPVKVDAALLAIREAAGTAIVGGVNLDTVRANLAVSQKIQKIAEQIDLEVKRSGQMDTKKMAMYAAELNRLQQQIRPDVTAPAAGTTAQ